ncbi:aquaporin family protein [Paenibacillus sp. SYP-B3998]|uniref:Aquaporin family protein n=1 Tax=Paenibacillus sp. SYP-B3998 TaxID=2678564 RepID=A0A6G4A134_9BACL|nr:MIP/aquaporin family protein [Paenibacillus sp. SYP-B3998]NEW08085.1 aquaporin family protein [Paenibacillus sp. SYP-B3998]
MSPFFGELIGTMILIILGGGVCAGASLKKSYSNSPGWIVITMGWGMAVAFAAFAVGKISGAHLNPALTIALASIGEFPWKDVPSYITAQLLGAFVGATFVWVFYFPHWKATEDPATKLGVFATGPAIKNTGANFISEALGTFFLVFGILAIGANKFADGLNPLIVGFFILAIGLSLGGTTGYAINPARDLGPRIAHAILPIHGKGHSNWGYAWIPVIAPIVGGVAGAQFYRVATSGNQTLTIVILAVFFLVAIVVGKISSSQVVEPALKQKKVG